MEDETCVYEPVSAGEYQPPPRKARPTPPPSQFYSKPLVGNTGSMHRASSVPYSGTPLNHQPCERDAYPLNVGIALSPQPPPSPSTGATPKQYCPSSHAFNRMLQTLDNGVEEGMRRPLLSSASCDVCLRLFASHQFLNHPLDVLVDN